MTKGCSVCLAKEVASAFKVNDYQLSRCMKCGHLFVSDPINPKALESIYQKGYYGTNKANAPSETIGYTDYMGNADRRMNGFRHSLAGIERLTGYRGDLLDYGCAVGLFVKVAKEAGWNARGYERSQWAVQYGREVLGLDIECADGALNPFPPQSFDVVTLWDVLEHLEHPRQILNMVHEWLRPGGLIVMNTVNSSSLGARLAGKEWRHLAPPGHLQYFTRDSLARLLHETGFAIKGIRGRGTLFENKRDCDRLSWPLRQLEQLATHWRLRHVVDALNLLDEVEVTATAKPTAA